MDRISQSDGHFPDMHGVKMLDGSSSAIMKSDRRRIMIRRPDPFLDGHGTMESDGSTSLHERVPSVSNLSEK